MTGRRERIARGLGPPPLTNVTSQVFFLGRWNSYDNTVVPRNRHAGEIDFMIQLNEVKVDDRITHLVIIGQLDVAGMHAIDVKFHGYTAARRRPTVVDIAGLDFISSLGMGMFMSCARSLQRFGAKMVLLNPRAEVEEALKAVGIDKGVPIVRSTEEADLILFPAS